MAVAAAAIIVTAARSAICSHNNKRNSRNLIILYNMNSCVEPTKDYENKSIGYFVLFW